MILVDYEKLPPQFNVIRGGSVNHIIDYGDEDWNNELLAGHYACNGKATILVINTDRYPTGNMLVNKYEEYLTCKRCIRSYNRILNSGLKGDEI